MKTIVTHIGMLATPLGRGPRKGRLQGQIQTLRDAWVLMEEGAVAQVGTGPAPGADQTIDARDRLVTPGLVDAHTHLIFGGWRQHELGMKLRGASYLEILAQGGGILSTVSATRAASQEELADKAGKALDEMLSLGTTTCEAKSGYGLDVDTELKQLRASACSVRRRSPPSPPRAWPDSATCSVRRGPSRRRNPESSWRRARPMA